MVVGDRASTPQDLSACLVLDLREHLVRLLNALCQYGEVEVDAGAGLVELCK